MHYFFAFLLLIALGLGVNYLMLRLFKNKRAQQTQELHDDPLSLEMREALETDVEGVKRSLQDLMSVLQAQKASFEAREQRLCELIAQADERITQLNAARALTEKKEAVQENQNFQSPAHKIHALAQQGMQVTEIARSLGLGVGEVELRLGLLSKLR